MSLHRTQVLLEPWQHERLKELALERRTTMSELVRQMVSKGLQEEPRRRRLLDMVGVGRPDEARGFKPLDEELYGRGSKA